MVNANNDVKPDSFFGTSEFGKQASIDAEHHTQRMHGKPGYKEEREAASARWQVKRDAMWARARAKKETDAK